MYLYKFYTFVIFMFTHKPPPPDGGRLAVRQEDV